MEDVAATDSHSSAGSLAGQYVLGVDGAGVFLLCLAKEVTLGGVRQDDNHADVCLLSNLNRQHAAFVRSHGNYHIKALGLVRRKNSLTALNPEEYVALKPAEEWILGDGVEVQIQQPTPLSLTTIVEFQSSHRPQIGQPPVTIDRVILMDQNCLIGPGGGQHIPLNDSQDGVILYRSKNQLWCKSKSPFQKNDEPAGLECPLQSGDVVTGKDFRFRIEAV